MGFGKDFADGFVGGYNRSRYGFGFYTGFYRPIYSFNNSLNYLSTCTADLDCPSGLSSPLFGGQPGVTFGGHGNDYLLSCNNYGFGGFGGFGLGLGLGFGLCYC